MRIRVLSRADVQRALSMSQAIEIVAEAFVQLSSGQAVVPVRTSLPVAAHNGVMLYMPAYLAGTDALGLKAVSVFPDNPRRGQPTIMALVVVNDAASGEPRAVIEGSYLTALRTGAASGVATRLMARVDADAVAVFGAGVQGRTQLEAVCTVRRIERAWVYDLDREAAERFAAEMGRRPSVPRDIRVAASPTEAVRQADIVCTATTSRTPVFAHRDLKPGVHINGIGSFTPEMQEVDPETVQHARIVVDSREAAWAEAGDLIIPRDQGLIGAGDIYAELGEIAAGRKRGRWGDAEITFFKAVGNAVQDVAVANHVLGNADAENLGTVMEI